MSSRTLVAHREDRGVMEGGGFLSMSRFARMGFDEARSALPMERGQPSFHPPPLSSLRRIRSSGLNREQDSSWAHTALDGDQAVDAILPSFGGLNFGGHPRFFLSRTRQWPGSAGRVLIGTSRSHAGRNDDFDEYQALQLLDEGVKKRGVSDKRLRQLRVRRVDRSLTSKERCHVCQCEYQRDDEVMDLPCKHVFHPDCIKGWFKENRTCPICRHEVEA